MSAENGKRSMQGIFPQLAIGALEMQYYVVPPNKSLDPTAPRAAGQLYR